MKIAERIVTGGLLVALTAGIAFQVGRQTAGENQVVQIQDMTSGFYWMKDGPDPKEITVETYVGIQLEIPEDAFNKSRISWEANKSALKPENNHQVLIKLGDKRRDLTFDEFSRMVEGYPLQGKENLVRVSPEEEKGALRRRGMGPHERKVLREKRRKHEGVRSGDGSSAGR